HRRTGARQRDRPRGGEHVPLGRPRPAGPGLPAALGPGAPALRPRDDRPLAHRDRAQRRDADCPRPRRPARPHPPRGRDAHHAHRRPPRPRTRDPAVRRGPRARRRQRLRGRGRPRGRDASPAEGARDRPARVARLRPPPPRSARGARRGRPGLLMAAGRGRRAGGGDTRAEILEFARELFAAKGYDGTSVRAVAREAGVDPALVHHYFAGKAALFAEVIGVPRDIEDKIAAAVAGPVDGAGERIVRTFLRVWDSPEGRTRFRAMVGAVATHEEAARMLQDFVGRTVLAHLGEVAGGARELALA